MAKVVSPKLIAAIAVVLIVFIPPFVKYQELLQKNRHLAKRIRLLTVENKDLEQRRRRLETDITYIERRAREKTGAVRKGEIVLQNEKAKTK